MNPLLGHEFPLESWLIPKLCPISWAITYTEVNPVLGYGFLFLSLTPISPITQP